MVHWVRDKSLRYDWKNDTMLIMQDEVLKHNT